jgi:hypothetical protein
MTFFRSLQVASIVAATTFGGLSSALADASECAELGIMWRSHRCALAATPQHLALVKAPEYEALRLKQQALNDAKCWRLDNLGKCEADWQQEADLDDLLRSTDAFKEVAKLPLFKYVLKLESQAVSAGCMLFDL